VTDLRFLCPQPAYTARPSASCGMPLYISAFAGTHCIYPKSEDQHELTSGAVLLYIKRVHLQTVTHLSTNLTRCRVTSMTYQQC